MQWSDETRYTLAVEDLDPFLQHRFGDIARRPEALHLKQTAAVARYLLWLSWDGVPNNIKASGSDVVMEYWPGETENDKDAGRCAGRVAERVWRDLLRYGEFQPSSKYRALGFLRNHNNMYVGNSDVERALDFVQRFDLPSLVTYPFRPPNLKSR